uniref:Uncharacterized protein n=1 Tax=viral metagenome TaxID=1070528 RepID=A0A6C0I603_9ZZZZ
MTEHVKVYVKSDQNPNGEKMYKTNAGIPFECVEFVRRYFMQTQGLTFPSVVDATDMFYRIHELDFYHKDINIFIIKVIIIF